MPWPWRDLLQLQWMPATTHSGYTIYLVSSGNCRVLLFVVAMPVGCLQWKLSNQDTNGAEENVIVSEVSWLKYMQEWYLGWEKVSCLERCPQSRSVLIEREVPLYTSLPLVITGSYSSL